MRGIEKQEKGVMTQAVEDLLNLIEISVESNVSPKKAQKTPAYTEKKIQLLTSVYCIYNNEIYDLLSKQKISVFMLFLFLYHFFVFLEDRKQRFKEFRIQTQKNHQL